MLSCYINLAYLFLTLSFRQLIGFSECYELNVNYIPCHLSPLKSVFGNNTLFVGRPPSLVVLLKTAPLFLSVWLTSCSFHRVEMASFLTASAVPLTMQASIRVRAYKNNMFSTDNGKMQNEIV